MNQCDLLAQRGSGAGRKMSIFLITDLLSSNPRRGLAHFA